MQTGQIVQNNSLFPPEDWSDLYVVHYYSHYALNTKECCTADLEYKGKDFEPNVAPVGTHSFLTGRYLLFN